MKFLLNLLQVVLTFIAKFSTNKAINSQSKIVNFTPYIIVLLNDNNGILFIFESDGVARCTTSSNKIETINNIDLKKVVLGKIDELPKKQKNTFIIISNLVLQSSSRKDLIVPCDYVRNDKCQIIGCKSFSK